MQHHETLDPNFKPVVKDQESSYEIGLAKDDRPCEIWKQPVQWLDWQEKIWK